MIDYNWYNEIANNLHISIRIGKQSETDQDRSVKRVEENIENSESKSDKSYDQIAFELVHENLVLWRNQSRLSRIEFQSDLWYR